MRRLATFVVVMILTLPSAAFAEGNWKRSGGQGTFNFVQADAGATADDIRVAVAEICGGKGLCQVMVWVAPDAPATAMPLSDGQYTSLAAQWSQNPNTGFRSMSWDCSRFPDQGDDCLSTE